MNKKVDDYLRTGPRWRDEMQALRAIALECGLSETWKWGKPCYAIVGHNVLILQAFKESCALMFFKGSLLSDGDGILEAPGAASRIARRIRVTNVAQVNRLKSKLKACIKEAIEVERAGLKVDRSTRDMEVPEEFDVQLQRVRGLRKAFENLTPGRQRAYLLHFAGAKQSKTRAARVEKYIPRILEGRGMDD